MAAIFTGVQPDVIVLDPPRKGCDVHLIDTVVNMAPRRVVYVSCDPATLARDLKLFGEKGYETREATPVDLFPRTGHVETVVLLSKGEIDSKKVRGVLSGGYGICCNLKKMPFITRSRPMYRRSLA